MLSLPSAHDGVIDIAKRIRAPDAEVVEELNQVLPADYGYILLGDLLSKHLMEGLHLGGLFSLPFCL